MTIVSTISKIETWADDRNLIHGSDPVHQFAKLMSEFGELSDHIVGIDKELKNLEENMEKIKDDIGDCFVVMTIIAMQINCPIGSLFNGESLDLGSDELFFYLASRLGALGDNCLKNNYKEIKLNISMLISLFMELCRYFNIDFDLCVDAAYNDIKDRKGVMYNGAFIKEKDPRYSEIIREIEEKRIFG